MARNNNQADASSTPTTSGFKAPKADIKWDTLKGHEFGGQAPILEMEVGDIVGPLTYSGKSTIVTEKGTAISHTAQLGDQQIRLPLSATFIRAVDQAALNSGDQFYVRRDEDVKGKTGKAKGQTLQVYCIKVTERDEIPG